MSRSNPALGARAAGAAGPGVVFSGNALAIQAARWSICVCAWTKILSRNVTSAAICPEVIELVAIISREPPLANLIEIVPVRDLVGLASHCEAAFSVPCELKIRVEAWDPTSSTPLGVYTVV